MEQMHFPSLQPYEDKENGYAQSEILIHMLSV
jgi:hypothetical protein